MNKEKTEKKIIQSLTAFTLSASLLIGGLFNSPAEIINEEDKNLPPEPIQITCTLADEDDDNIAEQNDNEDKKKKGLQTRLRNFFQDLPLSVKLFVIVPLWSIGSGILFILGEVLLPLLQPFFSKALFWLIALALAALFLYLTGKLLFPGIKVKDIFNKKRTVVSLFIIMIMLVGEGILSRYEWGEIYAALLRAIGPFAVIGGYLLSVKLNIKEKKLKNA